jgi:hypothetical protein
MQLGTVGVQLGPALGLLQYLHKPVGFREGWVPPTLLTAGTRGTTSQALSSFGKSTEPSTPRIRVNPWGWYSWIWGRWNQDLQPGL